MPCERCREDSPPGARFCPSCGAKLPEVCAACGDTLPAGARFCPSCGRPTTPDAKVPEHPATRPVPPPPTPASPPAPATIPLLAQPAPPALDPRDRPPTVYTPAHLAEKILTSRSMLEGERKPVTVLFCDLANSTPLAERLGPETMHLLLSRFFEAALATVHRFEGTVNQFLGDGFMALFGAPVAHEDHARRAVLAAVALAEAFREHPVTLDGSPSVTLEIRMGLHTGLVVVGAIGDNLRMDYTAVGDTTNLAARLQQLADPGTVLVSEATARLVEGDVRLVALGPMAIKGKAQPVPVWRVLGVAPRRSAAERLEGRRLSPFVGRARELATLLDRLEQAEGGQGQTVGIVGEPGVGKSRLLLELRRQLGKARATYLAGRCVSYGATTPYLPVLDLVRAAAGIVDADTPETVADRLRTTLTAVGMDAEEALPYLLILLGLKDRSEGLEHLGAEAFKTRTFATLRQWMLRTSRRRPLVLEIEDLHWIDRTSEECLLALADDLAGAPVLLLGTYRPGYRPPWMERSFATQLALARLSPSDSLAVIRAVVPQGEASGSPEGSPERGPDAALVRVILDKAEGNPFFLEELARAVADQDAGAPDFQVPDTVQGVLLARIDRLPDAPKRLLQAASVLGREFSVRLLRAVVDDESLDAHLETLRRLEFIYERSDANEPVYVLKHALTQDVAHTTLLGPRRRELHRRAATALEALYPERLPELAAVLARHCLEAEAWGPAAAYAGRAAAAARAAYANQEAIAHYDRALAAARRAELGAVERLLLLEGRGDVHALLGDFDQARADLEAALALADESADPAARGRLLGALAELWGGHQDYQRALALTREAAAVATTTGDRRALGRARLRVGLMLTNVARMAESREELEAALDLFRAVSDEPGQAQTLDVLGMATFVAGDLDRALAYADEAMRRLDALGDRETAVSALALLALTLAYQGDWSQAAPRFRDALDAAGRIGARGQIAYIHLLSAEAAEPFGAYALALREATAGLALARELGHREWVVGSLGALGRVRRALGDLVTARRLHEEMVETSRELGSVIWTTNALGELGQDLVALDELDAAEACLTEAVQMGREGTKFLIRPLLAHAELALRRGQLEVARARAADARRRIAPFRLFAEEARHLEAEALLALGHSGEAEAALRTTKAEATARGAHPLRWRAAFALARLLRASGRDAEALAEAGLARQVAAEVAGELPDADLGARFLLSVERLA